MTGRSTTALLGVWLAAVATGCSTGTAPPPGPAGCPALSTECPSPVPSWSGKVEAIINASCATAACHGDGGIESAAFNYTSYAGVKAASTRMITQVNLCLMPLPDASPPPPALSAADRQVLLAWLVCGAPEN